MLSNASVTIRFAASFALLALLPMAADHQPDEPASAIIFAPSSPKPVAPVTGSFAASTVSLWSVT